MCGSVTLGRRRALARRRSSNGPAFRVPRQFGTPSAAVSLCAETERASVRLLAGFLLTMDRSGTLRRSAVTTAESPIQQHQHGCRIEPKAATCLLWGGVHDALERTSAGVELAVNAAKWVPARPKVTPDRERRVLAILAAGQVSRWCFTGGFLFRRRVHDLLVAVQEGNVLMEDATRERALLQPGGSLRGR